MPRTVGSLSRGVPRYRKHRASGQAVVTLSGQDFYLGPHGTKTSHREYDRVVAEWLARGRTPLLGECSERSGPLTLVEVMAAYKRHAKSYYRKHGPGKHRTWRKLHLAINPQTHEIEAEVLTENNCIDATPVPELLAAIPGSIRSLRGDAAYDKWLVYDALELRH